MEKLEQGEQIERLIDLEMISQLFYIRRYYEEFEHEVDRKYSSLKENVEFLFYSGEPSLRGFRFGDRYADILLIDEPYLCGTAGVIHKKKIYEDKFIEKINQEEKKVLKVNSSKCYNNFRDIIDDINMEIIEHIDNQRDFLGNNKGKLQVILDKNRINKKILEREKI